MENDPDLLEALRILGLVIGDRLSLPVLAGSPEKVLAGDVMAFTFLDFRIVQS